MSRASERGAVAVEFAILAPVLVMLLLGIMEFGRAYNAQISLTNAAREGVRVMAITNNQAQRQDRGQERRSALSPALRTRTSPSAPPNCAVRRRQMTVTISYNLPP